MMAHTIKASMVQNLVLALILCGVASAQARPEPVEVELCKVVASPGKYDGKLLSVEGILSPSEHSLVLYSPSCKPREGLDVGIQAVFPPAWDSWPLAKQLQRILRSRKNAHVRVSGTFESGIDRYGPDVDRFRFTITEISSVKKTPPDGAQMVPATDTLAHESGHVDQPKPR